MLFKTSERVHRLQWLTNMCRLGCGEEGHDWVIQHISQEKGLGMVALRNFQRGDRILAERLLPSTAILKGKLNMHEQHAIDGLMPEGGSMQDKLDTNALSTDDGGGICVRLVRANHACVPNACNYDEYSGVKLLVARTAIRKGEEITISYVMWYNLLPECDTSELRKRLVSRGINCGVDCKCYDQNVLSKLLEAQELYQDLKPKDFYVCGGTAVPCEKLERLRQLVEELELSHVNVSAVCYAAHAEHLYRGDLEGARKYAQKSLEMNVEIMGVNSESAEYDEHLLSELE